MPIDEETIKKWTWWYERRVSVDTKLTVTRALTNTATVCKGVIFPFNTYMKGAKSGHINMLVYVDGRIISQGGMSYSVHTRKAPISLENLGPKWLARTPLYLVLGFCVESYTKTQHTSWHSSGLSATKLEEPTVPNKLTQIQSFTSIFFAINLHELMIINHLSSVTRG